MGMCEASYFKSGCESTFLPEDVSLDCTKMETILLTIYNRGRLQTRLN